MYKRTLMLQCQLLQADNILSRVVICLNLGIGSYSALT